MNKKTFIVSCVISVVLAGSAHAAGGCKANKTNKDNEIYWVSDSRELVELKKHSSSKDIFQLEETQIGWKRKLRFIGHMRDYKYATPAVIKISAWSKDAKENTQIVYLHKDKSVRSTKKRLKSEYSLVKYQKHHRQGLKQDDTYLKSHFHYQYKNQHGLKRRTDDRADRRDRFKFVDVPNTYKGNMFSALFNIFSVRKAYARGQGKYIYLKAILHDLQRSPCFSFSVSLPQETDRVVLEVQPVEEELIPHFGRGKWSFQK